MCRREKAHLYKPIPRGVTAAGELTASEPAQVLKQKDIWFPAETAAETWTRSKITDPSNLETGSEPGLRPPSGPQRTTLGLQLNDQ